LLGVVFGEGVTGSEVVLLNFKGGASEVAQLAHHLKLGISMLNDLGEVAEVQM
jgi:hypothetical protein